MAIEDFTTYTEVDPETKVTVAAAKITSGGLEKDDGETYVYDDKGALHFGNFTHLYELKVVVCASDGPYLISWGVANTIDGFSDWNTNDDQVLCIESSYKGSANLTYVRIWNTEAGTNDITSDLTRNVKYYLKVLRDGTSITAYVYDDAPRTNLIDSVTVGITVGRSYRYVFPLNKSSNADTTDTGAEIALPNAVLNDQTLPLPDSGAT